MGQHEQGREMLGLSSESSEVSVGGADNSSQRKKLLALTFYWVFESVSISSCIPIPGNSHSLR